MYTRHIIHIHIYISTYRSIVNYNEVGNLQEVQLIFYPICKPHSSMKVKGLGQEGENHSLEILRFLIVKLAGGVRVEFVGGIFFLFFL